MPQYNHCGQKVGVLIGQKNHPLMCGEAQWLPSVNQVQQCWGRAFEQCATLGITTRCRQLYSRNKGWAWAPAINTVCSGEQYTQTSNCGFTRQMVGSKNCCAEWSPSSDTVCSGEPFVQTSGCGESRQAVGTAACCTNETWSPLPASQCKGLAFTQTSSCGGTRSAVGSNDRACILEDKSQIHLNEGDFPKSGAPHHLPKEIARLTAGNLLGQADSSDSATNTAKLYSRRMPDATTGAVQYHPVEVTALNLLANTQIPMFTRGDDFYAFLAAKATNSLQNNPLPSDEVVFCLDSDLPPSVSWTDDKPRTSACGTHTVTQYRECAFNTVGSLFPLCDECDDLTTPSTRTVSYTIAEDSNWQPNPNTICTGQQFTQGNDCGSQRSATGTKQCESEPSDPDLEWDYVGEELVDMTLPSAPPSFDLFSMACWKFENGSLGEDRRRKWLRKKYNNQRYQYLCNIAGEADWCYIGPTGEQETPIGGIEEVTRVDFRCR